MRQHINIRVSNCLECPLSETEKPLHASTIGSWPVMCNHSHTAVGNVESCSRGISEQCTFKKVTDIEDALED